MAGLPSLDGWEPVADEVNHPPHYTKGKVECIDAIEAALTPEEYRGYLKGNIIKYTWRERHKGGIQSLEKALFYLNRLLQKKTPPDGGVYKGGFAEGA